MTRWGVQLRPGVGLAQLHAAGLGNMTSDLGDTMDADQQQDYEEGGDASSVGHYTAANEALDAFDAAMGDLDANDQRQPSSEADRIMATLVLQAVRCLMHGTLAIAAELRAARVQRLNDGR